MTADLVVVGGIVVTSGGRAELDLAISDGVFAAIMPRGQLERSLSAGARRVDADGRFVLPGVIDGHVHFRDPFETGACHRQSPRNLRSTIC